MYFATSHDYFGRRHFYQGFAEELARRRTTFLVSAVRLGYPRDADVTTGANGLQVITPVIPRGLSRMGWLRNRLVGRQVKKVVAATTATVDVVGQTADMDPFIRNRRLVRKSAFIVADEVTDPRERFVLKHVDLVMAASPIAYERYQSFPRVVQLPGGAEIDPYLAAAAAQRVPHDLAELPRPWFGYGGSLTTHRLDFAALHALADQRVGTVVLVGPVLGDPAPLERLLEKPNVIALGHRDESVAPAYLAAFDVSLIPYALTPFNLGCNPTKFYEYLATGRPIVSTNLPSLAPFADVVALTTDPQAFAVAAVRAALEKDDLTARRQQLSRQHSMPALVDHVQRFLDEMPRAEGVMA